MTLVGDTTLIENNLCIAAALSFPSDPSDPFSSITPDSLERDIAINAIGGYTALRESIQDFKHLTDSTAVGSSEQLSKSLPQGVFIATGNVTPFQPLPMALTLGAGKSALVHLIQLAIETHESNGFRYVISLFVTLSWI